MSDQTRIRSSETLPETFKRLQNLHQHVERMADEHGVSLLTLELVKIRASQINGCAYCVDQHVGKAQELGEGQQRLHMLSVWRETDLFDEKEQAALALSEAMSRLPVTKQVPDDVYAQAAGVFSAEQLAVVIWAASAIQTSNALNVVSRTPVTRRD